MDCGWLNQHEKTNLSGDCIEQNKLFGGMRLVHTWNCIIEWNEWRNPFNCKSDNQELTIARHTLRRLEFVDFEIWATDRFVFSLNFRWQWPRFCYKSCNPFFPVLAEAVLMHPILPLPGAGASEGGWMATLTFPLSLTSWYSPSTIYFSTHRKAVKDDKIWYLTDS